MRILKLFLPLALVCLIAAACSSDSEDSAPAAPTSEATEAPESEPTEVAEGLTAAQQEIADAIFTVMMESDERPPPRPTTRSVVLETTWLLSSQTSALTSWA